MKRFALAAVLCVLTVSSVLTLRAVPFHAAIATAIAIPAPCDETCAINISGVGQAAHMGRVSIDGPSLIFRDRGPDGNVDAQRRGWIGSRDRVPWLVQPDLAD